MNINDSNRHFEKLSNFYKQISADGQINQIELDLLKSYTLSFYESIAVAQASNSSAPANISKVEAPVIASRPTIQAAPKVAVQEPAIAEQAPAEVLLESSNEVTKKLSKDLESLFSLETGNEISDKLSTTSIKDIGKAMSINERIFTIKELFGGSQENFDKAINSLNGFATYADAKAFLSESVVSENNWLNPDKSKKVKTFLKLISRKYV